MADPQLPDITQELEALPYPNEVKADLYDAFYAPKQGKDEHVTAILDRIDVPKELKNSLLDRRQKAVYPEFFAKTQTPPAAAQQQPKQEGPGTWEKVKQNAPRSAANLVTGLAMAPAAPLINAGQSVKGAYEGFKKDGAQGALEGSIKAGIDPYIHAAEHVAHSIFHPQDSIEQDPFGTVLNYVAILDPVLRAGTAVRAGATEMAAGSAAKTGVIDNLMNAASKAKETFVGKPKAAPVASEVPPSKSAKESAKVFESQGSEVTTRDAVANRQAKTASNQARKQELQEKISKKGPPNPNGEYGSPPVYVNPRRGVDPNPAPIPAPKPKQAVSQNTKPAPEPVRPAVDTYGGDPAYANANPGVDPNPAPIPPPKVAQAPATEPPPSVNAAGMTQADQLAHAEGVRRGTPLGGLLDELEARMSPQAASELRSILDELGGPSPQAADITRQQGPAEIPTPRFYTDRYGDTMDASRPIDVDLRQPSSRPITPSQQLPASSPPPSSRFSVGAEGSITDNSVPRTEVNVSNQLPSAERKQLAAPVTAPPPKAPKSAKSKTSTPKAQAKAPAVEAPAAPVQAEVAKPPAKAAAAPPAATAPVAAPEPVTPAVTVTESAPVVEPIKSEIQTKLEPAAEAPTPAVQVPSPVIPPGETPPGIDTPSPLKGKSRGAALKDRIAAKKSNQPETPVSPEPAVVKPEELKPESPKSAETVAPEPAKASVSSDHGFKEAPVGKDGKASYRDRSGIGAVNVRKGERMFTRLDKDGVAENVTVYEQNGKVNVLDTEDKVLGSFPAGTSAEDAIAQQFGKAKPETPASAKPTEEIPKKKVSKSSSDSADSKETRTPDEIEFDRLADEVFRKKDAKEPVSKRELANLAEIAKRIKMQAESGSTVEAIKATGKHEFKKYGEQPDTIHVYGKDGKRIGSLEVVRKGGSTKLKTFDAEDNMLGSRDVLDLNESTYKTVAKEHGLIK